MTNLEWLITEWKDILIASLNTGRPFGVDEKGNVSFCRDMNCTKCIFLGCCRSTKFEEWLETEHGEYSIPWDTPIDTKVLVRDNEGAEWKRRHFAGFGNDTSRPYRCYAYGKTSWSTDGVCLIWKYCKLAEQEE